MAPHKQQKTPSDDKPVQQQIVVAPQDTTKRPGQQQVTGNSHDRPASLQVPTATGKPLGQDQRELQKSDDTVDATDHGKKRRLPPSDEQTPSKTVPPAKAKGKWCERCTKRKAERGIDGRSRRNAVHGCEDCAKLRGEEGPRGKTSQARLASLSNPIVIPSATQARPKPGNPWNSGSTQPVLRSLPSTWQRQNPGETAQSVRRKGWKLAVPSKQRQKQNRGFDPGTESDDSANPPKPNIGNPLVDIFGTPVDPSLSNRQIPGFGHPRTAYPPHPPLRQSPVVSGARQPSGFPGRGAIPTPNSMNPSQVEGNPNQPLPYGAHPLAMQTPSRGPFTSPLASNDNTGSQQQRSGERPGAFDLFPFVPTSSPGGPSDPNAIQGNASFSHPFTYPEPMELEPPRMTGEPSHGPTAVVGERFLNTFEASSPAPFNFSGVPAPAGPAPANPPVCQRHAGLRPGSIDPMLSSDPQ